MEMPRNFILCFIKQFLQKQYIFKNVTKRSSILLGFEVANRVLSHLTCSAIKESSVDLVSDIFFTKKELNIINYLSGYVFGTFYRVCLAAKVYKSC